MLIHTSTLSFWHRHLHTKTHTDTVAVGYSSQLWQSSSLLFLHLVSLSSSTACVCIAGVCMCVCGCVVSARHCAKDATSGSWVSQILPSFPFSFASVYFLISLLWFVVPPSWHRFLTISCSFSLSISLYVYELTLVLSLPRLLPWTVLRHLILPSLSLSVWLSVWVSVCLSIYLSEQPTSHWFVLIFYIRIQAHWSPVFQPIISSLPLLCHPFIPTHLALKSEKLFACKMRVELCSEWTERN